MKGFANLPNRFQNNGHVGRPVTFILVSHYLKHDLIINHFNGNVDGGKAGLDNRFETMVAIS